MKIPERDITITSLIDKAHEAKKELPRPHMGCSGLGHYCDRWIWLSFRWAVQPEFPGRIKRLFRRGHNEEATIISDLRAIGMSVTRSQLSVDLGCHVAGSLDGIGKGVPEAPNTEHVLEFKTHSLKSFNDLDKNGVMKSKPMHYTQMQLYMYGTGLKRALYLAVCKDNDEIYTERIEYDKEHAKKYIDRGHRLALTDRLPPPISTDPSWFECKLCDGHIFCHKTKTTKHVNCRTCAHITPLSDSTWHCAKWDAIVPTEHQYTGCESHVLHPDLVPWKRLDSPSDWVAVYEINGLGVANGEPGEGVYASSELLANAEACAIPDERLVQLRQEFDGRIVG